MMNLLGKMKSIEDERQDTRKAIKMLKEKLENLTGRAVSSEEKLEAASLSAEEESHDIAIIEKRSGDVQAYSTSWQPRFMKPTVCSRRKSEKDNQMSGGRNLVAKRRKRSSSFHMESESLPVKQIFGSNSECSLSRSTCFQGLNTKSNADTETDHSQDISECDIKMIVFQEGENLQQISNQEKACFSHPEKNGSGKTKRSNSTKFSSVGSWHGLHKNEHMISTHANMKKRVLAAPAPEKKYRYRGKSKTDILYDKKLSNNEVMTQKIINYNNMQDQVNVQEAEQSTSEVTINKQLIMLKDLFDEQVTENSLSLSPEPDGWPMLQTHESENGKLIDETDYNTLFLPTVGQEGFSKIKDDDGVHILSITEVLKGETQCLDRSIPENIGCQFSLPYLHNNLDVKEDKNASISISELELHCEHIEPCKKDSKKGERSASPEPSQIGRRHGEFKLRSEPISFIEDTNKRDLTEMSAKSLTSLMNKGKHLEVYIKCGSSFRPNLSHLKKHLPKPNLFQNMKLWETLFLCLISWSISNLLTHDMICLYCILAGICHTLKQKIQILCASVLLGLGFCNLGLDHDFFYGLVL